MHLLDIFYFFKYGLKYWKNYFQLYKKIFIANFLFENLKYQYQYNKLLFK